MSVALGLKSIVINVLTPTVCDSVVYDHNHNCVSRTRNIQKILFMKYT